ncbi:MAG: hypothetical protein RR065_01130, partial [Clostridia bacterium]
MAFYKEAKDKPRQEKREAAEKRGGFEDEGSKYSRGGRPGEERRSYAGGAPRAGSSFGHGAPRREGGSSFGNGAPRREG